MIKFEKEVCEHLNLPAIPKKAWDGESAFDKGVAVIATKTGIEAYAVASFNPEKDTKPTIKKVFGSEPFTKVLRVYLVPDYMETDVTDADLDDESKKKAEEILKEATEIENEGTEIETPANLDGDNEYLFDFIHNDEEAIAYIEAYNKQNKIGGQTPKKHDTIIMRLLAIKSELDAKNK